MFLSIASYLNSFILRLDPLAQFFKGVHRNRIYVRIFIRVNICTYINAYICVVFLKKKTTRYELLLRTVHVSLSHMRVSFGHMFGIVEACDT
jgi:hypothetical protein